MEQIFIVTTGEYSDYTIDRVFSTRQKALEYLDTKDDDYTLEVFDIDEPIVRNTKLYRIGFYLDKKEVCHCNICYNKRYKDLIHINSLLFNGKKILYIYVESDSRKRALKVASERYGAIVAGEQTMFPYLRVGLLQQRYNNDTQPAYYDFNTGELVLMDNQKLAVELPDFIKIKQIKNNN